MESVTCGWCGKKIPARWVSSERRQRRGYARLPWEPHEPVHVGCLFDATAPDWAVKEKHTVVDGPR